MPSLSTGSSTATNDTVVVMDDHSTQSSNTLHTPTPPHTHISVRKQSVEELLVFVGKVVQLVPRTSTSTATKRRCCAPTTSPSACAGTSAGASAWPRGSRRFCRTGAQSSQAERLG